jgi:hypothetical protein
MTEPRSLASTLPASKDPAAEQPKKASSRRAFLSQVSGAAAATLAAGTMVSAPASSAASQDPGPQDSGNQARARAQKCFDTRVDAAKAELRLRIPNEVTNGDEGRFPNYIGNFSKGLAHNTIGEVEPASYASLLTAVNSGDPRLFEQIVLGGSVPLVDPQAGLAFDLEGTDSHQLVIGTPPSAASREMADTAVENYWMALCRDVNFTQYGNEPLTTAAIAELNSLPAFRGPKPVTP